MSSTKKGKKDAFKLPLNILPATDVAMFFVPNCGMSKEKNG